MCRRLIARNAVLLNFGQILHDPFPLQVPWQGLPSARLPAFAAVRVRRRITIPIRARHMFLFRLRKFLRKRSQLIRAELFAACPRARY
jgi:hypothetical protein